MEEPICRAEINPPMQGYRRATPTTARGRSNCVAPKNCRSNIKKKERDWRYPDPVFALIFVSAFGLGPLAGVLAIGIHSFGTLGKLFTEVIENIDMKPVDGVRSASGRFGDVMRFGAACARDQGSNSNSGG
jgi:hypothetical protein